MLQYSNETSFSSSYKIPSDAVCGYVSVCVCGFSVRIECAVFFSVCCYYQIAADPMNRIQTDQQRYPKPDSVDIFIFFVVFKLISLYRFTVMRYLMFSDSRPRVFFFCRKLSSFMLLSRGYVLVAQDIFERFDWHIVFVAKTHNKP